MKYSPAGALYVAVCFLLTKIFYRKARLIRFPIDVRGAKFINFGNRLTTGYLCRIEAYPDTQATVLHIGDNVQINDFVHIAAKQSVVIGSNVLIASKVFISDINHGSIRVIATMMRPRRYQLNGLKVLSRYQFAIMFG